jgi:hypothetical protein
MSERQTPVTPADPDELTEAQLEGVVGGAGRPTVRSFQSAGTGNSGTNGNVYSQTNT